jgi:hypothetical protein
MFGLDITYLLLAYGGLILHVLLKLAEFPGGLFSGVDKKMVLVTIASIIAIPIILVICSGTSMADLLPINHVTAFLAGHQTQSFLRSIGSIGGKFKDVKNY